jgi:hypothetical protein
MELAMLTYLLVIFTVFVDCSGSFTTLPTLRERRITLEYIVTLH